MVWESNSHLAIQEIPSFMELEGSLPNSQQPATGFYHEAVESSPEPHIPIFNIHFNIYLPIYT